VLCKAVLPPVLVVHFECFGTFKLYGEGLNDAHGATTLLVKKVVAMNSIMFIIVDVAGDDDLCVLGDTVIFKSPFHFVRNDFRGGHYEFVSARWALEMVWWCGL